MPDGVIDTRRLVRRQFLESGPLSSSLQHPLQLLHPLLNLRLQFGEVGEDLFRRAVVDLFVDHLLVAIQAEVVALGGDVGLGDAEALGGPGALAFGCCRVAASGRGCRADCSWCVPLR